MLNWKLNDRIDAFAKKETKLSFDLNFVKLNRNNTNTVVPRFSDIHISSIDRHVLITGRLDIWIY